MSNAESYLRKLGELQAQYRGIQEQLHDRLPAILSGLDKLETDFGGDTDKDFPEIQSIAESIAELRAEVSSIEVHEVDDPDYGAAYASAMGVPRPAVKKTVVKRKRK